MLPSFDSDLPIHLGGINATLILYPQKMVFRLKGHIYPFRCAIPQERTITLQQLIFVQQDMRAGGGHLILTLADGGYIAIVYAEHAATQANSVYQTLMLFLNQHNQTAGAC